MFTSKTPHFFKVILEETVRDGKLAIPRNFVRKYGKQLPSPIQLEVPSGAIWKVELRKCDERVWFQKGWKEFVEHYSLKYGSFVVFRYEGNDRFHVLIFDTSASEIEYPCTSTEDDDMSVELIDDVSASMPQLHNQPGPYWALADGSIASRVKIRSLASDTERKCWQKI